MAIILISQGFRGVDFLRKPSVYLHFKAFAGPTKEGKFPQPVKLGPKTTVWKVADIRALIDGKSA